MAVEAMSAAECILVVLPAMLEAVADAPSVACIPVACDPAPGFLAVSVIPRIKASRTVPSTIMDSTVSTTIAIDSVSAMAGIGDGVLRGDRVGAGKIRGCGVRGTTKIAASTRTTIASTRSPTSGTGRIWNSSG